MSSITKTGLDLDVLPDALLDLAKAHMRVSTTDDDALIKSKLKGAISWFERITNVTVNPVTYAWTPDAANFYNGMAAIPQSPVAADFTVAAATGDVTANYAVTTASTHGIGLFALTGAWTDGLVMTFKSGFADDTVLDPGILDAVLRYTSHLYEHREILVPGAQVATPGWMTDVISTYWMPRV
jgi:uncharacterized phiE125 gp8 family phage protein